MDIIIYLAATFNVAASIEDVFRDRNSSFFLNFMEIKKNFLLKNCISIF
ncbi:UDP-glucose 4-epimerase [Bacillus cereus]|nr:UDP-glucose 4-epimerase [Bacillus cereus]